MAVLAPPKTPEYLKGYEQPITFDQRDHPPRVPYLGHSALVVSAQIDGYNMARVFMDGGSGINIIYADTLWRMNKNLDGPKNIYDNSIARHQKGFSTSNTKK